MKLMDSVYISARGLLGGAMAVAAVVGGSGVAQAAAPDTIMIAVTDDGGIGVGADEFGKYWFASVPSNALALVSHVLDELTSLELDL
ncbi:hypothetical protein SK803_41715 [Lentzea sp. BCCO 10_0856]|uniref:Uncharacterized protein n=1 Tax=Lentzea miocenica TaxID=3095431 RepID=A0ABU4TEX6_9PSEU|nr:hypothetical protein [Lentzea sp. BCCO 10_0856]MDX8036752.1 hypothetical protein [Lentzea sp. BCCO 10_0856]